MKKFLYYFFPLLLCFLFFWGLSKHPTQKSLVDESHAFFRSVVAGGGAGYVDWAGCTSYAAVYKAGYTLSGAEAAVYGARKYTTLAAAENGENGVVATGEVLCIDILDSSGGWNAAPDTTIVYFDGWDCQGTGKVVVRTLLGTEYAGAISSRPDWSDGQWDATHYALAVNSTVAALRLDNAGLGAGKYLDIEFVGMQIENTSGVAGVSFHINSGTKYFDKVKIDKCWIRKTTAASDTFYAACTEDYDIEIVNSVFNGGNVSPIGIHLLNTGETRVYNNTIMNSATKGLRQATASTLYLYNNIFAHNERHAEFVGGARSDDYNAMGLNAACTAADTPWACCTGEGAGTCNDIANLGHNVVTPSGDDWDSEFNTPFTNLTIDAGGNVQDGSPITNADDAYVPIDDILGNERNTGAGEDTTIGAFENDT